MSSKLLVIACWVLRFASLVVHRDIDLKDGSRLSRTLSKAGCCMLAPKKCCIPRCDSLLLENRKVANLEDSKIFHPRIHNYPPVSSNVVGWKIPIFTDDFPIMASIIIRRFPWISQLLITPLHRILERRNFQGLNVGALGFGWSLGYLPDGQSLGHQRFEYFGL